MSFSRQGAIKKSNGKTYGAVDSEPRQPSTGIVHSSATSEEFPRTDSSGKIKQLQRQVSEVKGILKDDIEKVIERGDKVHDLDDRTGILAVTSTQFRDSASTLRKATQRRNWKFICCIVVVILVVLAIVALVVLYALKII